MVRVYLGLGSNLGEGSGTIRSAFAALSAILCEARLSRLWGSKPMYDEAQPDFVNAAASGTTALSPRKLLAAVHGIEASFGRVRIADRPKGPRTLDIDILLYGGLVLREDDLTIPHAALRERLFALEPLLDLEPELLDPISGLSYASIAASLPPQGIYLLE
jgi:2-amino-4-hydroxy-6-hydroxymethyldihydropteridine diphosphokinase